ncbi:ribonuclease HII [Flagellimonas allohymeniacidonis]|uniref:ribonuclease HII n=1 Tax=Flagellimonas allohymeniacidonis TaxID=2517819 RepID=UPI001F0FCB59|nr:ribonuclease HII [Allomuricauda hymeniacidonis]
MKINNLAGFLSELRNNTFLDKSKSLAMLKSISEKADILNHIETDSKSLLGIYELGKENFEIMWVVREDSSSIKIDENTEKKIETLTYDNKSLTKYQIGDYEVFGTERNGHSFFSSSQMLVENLIRLEGSLEVEKDLQKLYDTASNDKSASFFFNLKTENPLLNQSSINGKNRGSFAEWMSLDFSSNQNSSTFNGLAVVSDSTKNYVGLFDGSNALPQKTADYAPLSSQAVISYTFDQYSQFAKRQNSYLDRVKDVDSLFNTIEEVGVIYVKGEKLVVLNSYGSESLSDYINQNTSSASTYQGSEIRQFRNKDFIAESFNPLIKDFESNYCTTIENAFVFTESKEPLQTLISSFKSGSTFVNSQLHKTALEAFANESNIYFVGNQEGLEILAEKEPHLPMLKDLEKSELKGYCYAAQFVADDGFAHANFLISKTEKPSKKNSVAPLFTLELDSDIAIDPQFVKNHRTNKQEVVVQDNDNFLYLISSEGKVLWKKQLEGRIQGEILQVDIYKNGRLQLAFCTNNQFLILDRNGKIVEPFNKKYEGGNLNSLAVFNYEGKKDYRFVVTQGRNVFMYNNKAAIVDGFIYTQAESDILEAPKHFRINNKDYLVFMLENKDLKILHRVGRDRVKIKDKIDFTENSVFLYKNKFSTTDKKGRLIQVDTQGKLTTTNFNLGGDHGMYATSKTLVFMDDNVLSIKGKKVELDLGVYSAPKIFYIYDKIYVSVTDIQNQKIYLFDSQAKPISNFPVFGNSLIDLIDMDNDRNLELVAKDQENSLIVYKMY